MSFIIRMLYVRPCFLNGFLDLRTSRSAKRIFWCTRTSILRPHPHHLEMGALAKFLVEFHATSYSNNIQCVLVFRFDIPLWFIDANKSSQWFSSYSRDFTSEHSTIVQNNLIVKLAFELYFNTMFFLCRTSIHFCFVEFVWRNYSVYFALEFVVVVARSELFLILIGKGKW